MPNIPRTRIKCDKCLIKIPKNQPKLRCSNCNSLKHLACQKLTKSDASQLIKLKINWTCTECIFDILPVNACMPTRIVKAEGQPKFKIKCSACNGFSYSAKNVSPHFTRTESLLSRHTLTTNFQLQETATFTLFHLVAKEPYILLIRLASLSQCPSKSATAQ